MIVAVITLAVLAASLGGGMIWVMKVARDERREAKQAADLYRKQQEVTFDLETQVRDLTGKLAATDAQLKDATIRLEQTEQQRNQALAEAREAIRREIRNAPDAVSALNKVIAAGHAAATGVRRTEETKAETAAAKPDSGSGGADSLLITDLR